MKNIKINYKGKDILIEQLPNGKYKKIDISMFTTNGYGSTWLDDCRIPFENDYDYEKASELGGSFENKSYDTGVYQMNVGHNFVGQSYESKGRFPANLLVSDDVLNDGKYTESDYRIDNQEKLNHNINMFEGGWKEQGNIRGGQDNGSFSRYFSLDNWFKDRVNRLPNDVKKVFPFLIVPKASPNEKQEGLDGFEKKQWIENSTVNKPQNGSAVLRSNFHPTVKPIDLMTYLVTLGSREQNLVLDPFMGSGTTAISCRLINRNFIGFELNPEYHKIAENRLKNHMAQNKLTSFF